MSIFSQEINDVMFIQNSKQSSLENVREASTRRQDNVNSDIR